MPSTDLRATFSAMETAARRRGGSTQSIMDPNPETTGDEEPAQEVGHARRAAAAAAGVEVPATSAEAPVVTEAEVSATVVHRTFKSKNPNHTKQFGWVDPTELVIDPQIQRGENKGLINGIAREYDNDAAGVITVSVREIVDPDTGEKSEILSLVDGQQRTRAAIRAGYTEKVAAMIHRGLSRAEEAELFRRLNFRRSVSAISLFKTAIVEGNEDVLNIVAALDDLDIPFSSSKGFTAVAVAQRLVKRKAGLYHFRWALVTVRAIYDTDGKGNVYDGRVIEAFARFHEAYEASIKEDELRSKLLKQPGGLAGLIGHAETIRAGAGGPMLGNLIQALVVRYNHNKHKDGRNKLPDWKNVPEVAAAAK